MKITTIGMALAKEIFAVHGVNERGHAVLRKQLKRSEMAKFFVKLEPCLIGMEACGSAHHWIRKLELLGHTMNRLGVVGQGQDVPTRLHSGSRSCRRVIRLVDKTCLLTS